MRTYEDYSHNNYKGDRTSFGNFMYRVTNKCARFFMKHMWLYYILNYTWGIIMTIIGWIVLGFIHLFLRKKVVEHGRFGPCHYAMLFDNWGGLELGTNFILADNMGEDWTLHTKCHEMGHTFQNALWGPFAIFLIFIPSAIRYWYQTIRSNKGKPNKEYDAFWAEESATDIGTDYYKNYLSK